MDDRRQEKMIPPEYIISYMVGNKEDLGTVGG